MKLTDIKTVNAFRIIILLIFSGLLVLGLFGGSGLNTMTKAQNELYLDRYLPTTQVYEVHIARDNTFIVFLEMMADGYSTKAEDIIKNDHKTVNDNINEYMKSVMTPEEKALMENLKETAVRYYNNAYYLIDNLKNKRKITREEIQKFKATAEKIESDIDKIIELNIGLSKKLDDDSDRSAAFIFTLFIIISVILLIIITLPSLYIVKRYSASVDQLISYCGEAAAGNLRADIPENMLASKNELGTIALSVHGMINKIRSTVSKIQDISTEVASSSEEMAGASVSFSENAQSQSAGTEEVTATVEEVSAGMEGIAQNALNQYDSLEKFIGMMHTMTSNLEAMSAQLAAARSESEEIVKRAESGTGSLTKMTDSMERVTSSSAEMTAIIAMINDISDRINLLSLNAAIEAARAGDAGKGFAVVADEISKLADGTASSIKDIDRLIKGNNSEIRSGQENLVSTINVITTIITGVNEIGSMMYRLSETMSANIDDNSRLNIAAKDMQNRANEIKSATDEQKIAMSEIVNSVGNINELTQTNAAGAEEMSGTSESLATMAENLRNTVEVFKV